MEHTPNNLTNIIYNFPWLLSFYNELKLISQRFISKFKIKHNKVCSKKVFHWKKHFYWFWGIIYCWVFFSIFSIINTFIFFFKWKKNLKILVELVFSQMWNLVKQLVQIFFHKWKILTNLGWLFSFKFDFFGEFNSIKIST
jgi:hypothetical protein